MRMNGTLAELMEKTDPKLYRKYLSDKKGKKGVVFTSKESLVRNDEERTSVLQKASIGVDWDGIHNQSL